MQQPLSILKKNLSNPNADDLTKTQKHLTILSLRTVALRKWLKGWTHFLKCPRPPGVWPITIPNNRSWQPLLSRTTFITPAASGAEGYLTVFLVRFWFG